MAQALLQSFRVVWLGKIHVGSNAVIQKVQTYAIPKNVKEVQTFVGILGLGGTFNAHLAQCLHPLYCLVKKGHVWSYESEQQAIFGKAKILEKQIETLGIS